MVKREVKIYSVEFKKSSAEFAAASGKAVAQIAQELGVNANTLHGWINKYAQAKSSVVSAEERSLKQEVAHLKKENARLTQERDILKKAAAYFASEIQ